MTGIRGVRADCRHGFTLMEMLIYVAVFALVAVSTLRVAGDARVMRANARDRSVMALIAQGEMDRIRTLPAAEIREGREARRLPEWPEGVEATVETKPRGDGTWLLDITVRRQSLEGKSPVRLTTVLPGGGV